MQFYENLIKFPSLITIPSKHCTFQFNLALVHINGTCSYKFTEIQHLKSKTQTEIQTKRLIGGKQYVSKTTVTDCSNNYTANMSVKLQSLTAPTISLSICQ